MGGEIAEVGGNGSLVKAATTTIGGRQWKTNVVIAGTKQEIILSTPNKSGPPGMRKRSIVRQAPRLIPPGAVIAVGQGLATILAACR